MNYEKMWESLEAWHREATEKAEKDFKKHETDREYFCGICAGYLFALNDLKDEMEKIEKEKQ